MAEIFGGISDQKIFYVLDIVELAFNPSTWETEVGRSL